MITDYSKMTPTRYETYAAPGGAVRLVVFEGSKAIYNGDLGSCPRVLLEKIHVTTDPVDHVVSTVIALDHAGREQLLERLRARMCLRCGDAVPQSKCYCDADD